MLLWNGVDYQWSENVDHASLVSSVQNHFLTVLPEGLSEHIFADVRAQTSVHYFTHAHYRDHFRVLL